MSMAFRGASDRDFEQSAQWLANAIKWYLSPKTAVGFIRRVVEIIQAQPDYQKVVTCVTDFVLTQTAIWFAPEPVIHIATADAQQTSATLAQKQGL